MAYNEQGKHNMNYKSDIGELHYNNDENAGVHAVTQIDWLTDRAETLPDHEIDYTPFNKVSHISEPVNNKDMYFMYGPEYNRKTMTYKKDGDLHYTRSYSGNCEKTTFANGNERKVYYISGGDGLAAAWVKENGQANLYYIHTDHLGSICAITDKDQNVVANYSFDAWGNRRDPGTWELTDNWEQSFTARGFTGHEHIDEFGLINMNGRIYDPTIGQFLSPDNYVQLPDASLGFNRYAYAINNPLLYIDPTGDFLFTTIMFGMAIVFTPPLYIISIPIYGFKGAWEEVYGKDDGLAKNMVELGMGLDEHLFGIEIRKDDDLTSGGSSSEATANTMQTPIDEYKIPDVNRVPIAGTDFYDMPNGCMFASAEVLSGYYDVSYDKYDYKNDYYNLYPEDKYKGANWFKFDFLFFSKYLLFSVCFCIFINNVYSFAPRNFD